MDRIVRALDRVRVLFALGASGRHRARQSPVPVWTAMRVGVSWHAGLPAFADGAEPWRTLTSRRGFVALPRSVGSRESFGAGLPARAVPAWQVHRGDTLIDADTALLVRRYLRESEQRPLREVPHGQWERRPALNLAVEGTEGGSHRIHGVEVAW